jgi:hypothetical protein
MAATGARIHFTDSLSRRILNPQIQQLVIPYLDRPSALALGCTNRSFFQACAEYHHLHLPQAQLPQLDVMKTAVNFPAGVATAVSTPSSAAASPNRTEVDSDGLSGSETDATSAEDDEWEFKITPDMMRRLSLLPQQQNPVATLTTIPTELQIEIFSHLDKIDSVCLGLTCRRAYSVYRAVYGTKMPLNTRRIGPNSLESAWVSGKQECKQCGAARCELWKHIRTWMPPNLEYCSMKQNFGSPARPGAAESCFRSKPSKPRRCGRHPVRTTTIHQDDSSNGWKHLLGN